MLEMIFTKDNLRELFTAGCVWLSWNSKFRFFAKRFYAEDLSQVFIISFGWMAIGLYMNYSFQWWLMVPCFFLGLEIKWSVAKYHVFVLHQILVCLFEANLFIFFSILFFIINVLVRIIINIPLSYRIISFLFRFMYMFPIFYIMFPPARSFHLALDSFLGFEMHRPYQENFLIPWEGAFLFIMERVWYNVLNKISIIKY